jgi:hypothetical protein
MEMPATAAPMITRASVYPAPANRVVLLSADTWRDLEFDSDLYHHHTLDHLRPRAKARISKSVPPAHEGALF